jgi:hypothetical protein
MFEKTVLSTPGASAKSFSIGGRSPNINSYTSSSSGRSGFVFELNNDFLDPAGDDGSFQALFPTNGLSASERGYKAIRVAWGAALSDTFTVDVDGNVVANDIDATGDLSVDTINEKTAASGVTIDGVLLKDSQVTTDVINEKTAAAGVTVDGVVCKDSGVSVGGFLNIGTPSSLTISGGVVTATKSNHTIAGEGALPDNLDTINGGTDGDVLVLRAANVLEAITVKDGTGNINCAGDFTMDQTLDTITLMHNGSTWVEISRSNNA